MGKELENKTTLSTLKPGDKATVCQVNGDNAISRRLMEMGIVPGVLIEIIKFAPFGDPMQVKLRGYSLALRKAEAQNVEVFA